MIKQFGKSSASQRFFLYDMVTNTGLKRVSGGLYGISYKEFLNMRRRFVHKDALRNAIDQVARANFYCS